MAQKLDIMGGITNRLWVARDGTTYKSVTDMMGLSMVATKTDRELPLVQLKKLILC